MPVIDDFSKTPRRDLNVIYVLDTSGSMGGVPIQILNTAMLETLDVLKKVASRNGDAQLKVSVMDFNTSAKWMQRGGPENIEDFLWTDLTAGGLTNVGLALSELNRKLCEDDFIKSASGTLLPIIIVMTDGYATDEYDDDLEVIRKNKLFRKATKIGFAIGEFPDVEMIAHIVGDSEAVVHSDDLALFAKLLQFVSVTSSTIASTSQVSGGAVSNGRTALEQAINMVGISKDEIRPDFEYLDKESVQMNSQISADSSFDAWEDNDDEW